LRATALVVLDKILQRFQTVFGPFSETTMTSNRPSKNQVPAEGIREKIHEIIFEADTPAGIVFDVTLLVAIVLSVIVICLLSIYCRFCLNIYYLFRGSRG